jgi:hypothetical protein
METMPDREEATGVEEATTETATKRAATRQATDWDCLAISRCPRVGPVARSRKCRWTTSGCSYSVDRRPDGTKGAPFGGKREEDKTQRNREKPAIVVNTRKTMDGVATTRGSFDSRDTRMTIFTFNPAERIPSQRKVSETEKIQGKEKIGLTVFVCLCIGYQLQIHSTTRAKDRG